MRSGRFKKHLIPVYELQKEGEILFPKIQELIQRKMKWNWSEAEFCLAYILIFQDQRKRAPFGGGRSKKNTWQGISQLEYVQIEDLLSNPWKKNKNKPLLENLKELTLRGLPESLNDVLLGWHEGQLGLDLLFHIPTPKEVLESQCQGRRCVTMALKKSQLQNYLIESRDPLGFLVHDLEHAAQFFHSETRSGQIEFYNKIQPVMDEIYSEFNDDEFKNDFDYVISDMNSHPEHLKQYLKAKMINQRVRVYGTIVPPQHIEKIENFLINL